MLGQDLVGILEIRRPDHISMLFVSSQYQQHGIATRLFTKAVEICLQQLPTLKAITVNSSPNAVPIYERLGFRRDAEKQEVQGIRFTPMAYDFGQPLLTDFPLA
jgi:GNAT superfamily N-acetyltransferase